MANDPSGGAVNNGGGAQRLWWRDEVAAQAVNTPIPSPAQAQSITTPEPVAQSAVHAPVVEADGFDTLWEELEAEAARRTENSQTVVEAQHAGLYDGVAIPLNVPAHLHLRASRRNQKQEFAVGLLMSAPLIPFAIQDFRRGVNLLSAGAWILSFCALALLHWLAYLKKARKLETEARRDDWRMSVDTAGMRFVTPWINGGKEETLLWSEIHELSVRELIFLGSKKERHLCVVRRNGMDFDGNAVTPQPMETLTPNEGRRQAWRRFFHLEPSVPKLAWPIVIPETALPITADTFIARIAVWEAGRAEATP